MRQFNDKATMKTASDLVVDEFGVLQYEHQSRCRILLYKEYQGSQEFICVIHPRKKHLQRILSSYDCQINRKVSEDRIIVETFFERLTPWSVMSSKWKWTEKLRSGNEVFCRIEKLSYQDQTAAWRGLALFAKSTKTGYMK